MRALGVMTTPNVRVVLAPARDHAVEYAGSHPTTDTYDEDVAFIGTVQAPEFVHDNVAAAFVQAFRERVLAAATEPTAAMWRPILQQMERTPAHELLAAQLTFDHPFFWLFVSFGILAEATMIGRQHLLRELGRPVSCYLLFDEPPESPLRKLDRIALKPAVDAITELPRLNAVTRVTVDLVSRNYIHAVTTKIIDCYAAGGFCLFNAQEDFRRAFGGDAEKVTYTDMADLNAKLEYFLSHERERRETAAHFQKLILERHQFATDIVATLEWAKALRR
jgi:hypothetical protein